MEIAKMSFTPITNHEAAAYLLNEKELYVKGEHVLLKVEAEREDDCCLHPRRDFEPLAHIVTTSRFTNRYGDFAVEPHDRILGKDENSAEVLEGYQQNENVFLKKLYVLDHSSVTISTEDFCDRWDSWCWGFIYISKDEMMKYFTGLAEDNWKDKAKEVIENEVALLKDYVEGNVYRYTISKVFDVLHTRLDTKETWTTCESEEVSSCGGFFGDDFGESGLLDEVLCECKDLLEEDDVLRFYLED